MRCQVHVVNKGETSKSLVKGEHICSFINAHCASKSILFPLDILGKLQTAKAGAAGHGVVESKANGYL